MNFCIGTEKHNYYENEQTTFQEKTEEQAYIYR